MNKKTVMMIFGIIFLFSTSAYSQYANITNGLTWLNSSQNQDGSWDSSTAATYYATAAVLNSFAALNETPSQYSNGLVWLQNQSFETNSTTYLASGISVFAHAGQSSSSNVNLLLSYRNTDYGWGGYKKYLSTIFHTALALQALHDVNYSDTTLIGRALYSLTNNQNTDGGWGFIPGEESNVYLTSLALKTLSLYKSVFIYQETLSRATSYLLTKQNQDGGFGNSPSGVRETAVAFDALVASGADISAIAMPAINYLTTTQATDGSWNQDPYSTALVLRTLANVRANLVIGTPDLAFSKPMPQANESVTITATVHNTGFDSASGVVVRFYLGDPSNGGIQINTDQVILTLPFNSSMQVSVTTSFMGTGSKTIYVVVDPDNLISETSEADNKTSARLWVATGPDIAVYSEDIKPSTYTPASGTAFTLEYTVRNLGESAADGFDVAIYDGPSTGSGQGILLQTMHISGLNGTEVRTGTFGVTMTGDGPHTLYLVADSGNLITESSKTNNTANVTVTVGGEQTAADLSVTSADITLTPSRPTAGDTLQITARIRNQGMDKAEDFLVEIFDGAPESGGVLINSQTVSSLPAAGELTITANWAITSGIHDLYVILDRSNNIVETDENNNKATMTETLLPAEF